MPIKSPFHQLSMSEVKDLSTRLGVDMKGNLKSKAKAVEHLSTLVDYSENKFVLKPREIDASEIQGKPRAPRAPEPVLKVPEPVEASTTKKRKKTN